MKLAMIEATDGPKLVGVEISDDRERFVDLTAGDSSLTGGLQELLGEEDGLRNAATAFATGLKQKRFIEGRLLAPIPRPNKVICIGLNYRDHAAETGAEIPTEPVVFSKFATAIAGPGNDIVLPAVAKQVDYEAELVVAIGRRGRNVPAERAFEHVAGYLCGNDVSARDWQKGRPGGQWLLGKTPDTFAPIGPYFVTADEIPDPHDLAVRLRLNGETMQDGNTREFIFGIDHVIAYISRLVRLEPGDLIFTGTPPGVGMARKPPVFLKAGDEVEVEIEGLGVLRNRVVAEA